MIDILKIINQIITNDIYSQIKALNLSKYKLNKEV